MKGTDVVLRGLTTPTAVLVLMATLLPQVRRKAWWARVFDFPRTQITALGLLALGAMQARSSTLSDSEQWLRRALSIALLLQGAQIARYTRLWRKQVPRASKALPNDCRVKMLLSNVLMTNRCAAKLKQLIREHEPDLVLLLEPDAWWQEQLADLEGQYPYSIHQPQENTYGMLLYSRLELRDPEVRFLVQPGVPSIRVRLRLPDGSWLRFFGVHPKPPGQSKPNGEVRGSGPRDAELVMIGREAADSNDPVIVAGDFNDVAWSYTTRRFQRLSGLLDPRVGRGLFNTFHADHPLARFPLDHLFHSPHFAVERFGCLPHIGSDHFPVHATLALLPPHAPKPEAPQADTEDIREAAMDVRRAPAERD